MTGPGENKQFLFILSFCLHGPDRDRAAPGLARPAAAWYLVYLGISLYMPRDGIKLALPRSSSPRWIGGACPPAQLGPRLLIEVLGLPSWVLGCAHGLWAYVWALGAGIKVLNPALQD